MASSVRALVSSLLPNAFPDRARFDDNHTNSSLIRICVCGDDDTGKSSLTASFVQDEFVPRPSGVSSVLAPITLPATLGGPDRVTTVIVDTSAQPQDRKTLTDELRKADVILLVYSNHYSYERVGLFWIPFFRSSGINLPIVLCANKADLGKPGMESRTAVAEDEMRPLMSEFREIEACIRASAKTRYNVTETFYLCEKAVRFPIAPLYDNKEGVLKPAAVTALRRVFFLSDKNKDGFLSDQEMHALQVKCFDKPLTDDEMDRLKDDISKIGPGMVLDRGLTEAGFLTLCRLFVVNGRHETVWMIVRKFDYMASLSLRDSFLHPRFEVPALSSAELSPVGYRFFADLFVLFDKDSDGGLSPADLDALFAHTPGLPDPWMEANFPDCTVKNEAGFITLQGWLALWSMTTFESPRTTLEYLAYLGFETTLRTGTLAGLKVTKARRPNRAGTVDRDVFFCYVVGSSGCGKSAFLDAFLNRPWNPAAGADTAGGAWGGESGAGPGGVGSGSGSGGGGWGRSRSAVNSVELPGGKQCYLVLQELGEAEEAVLSNRAKLDACDLVCYMYDSADSESFGHVAMMRRAFPRLNRVPGVYVALKADLDKATQRWEPQPDKYTKLLGLEGPIHTSVRWGGISEVFVKIANIAASPSGAIPPPELAEYDSGSSGSEDESAGRVHRHHRHTRSHSGSIHRHLHHHRHHYPHHRRRTRRRRGWRSWLGGWTGSGSGRNGVDGDRAAAGGAGAPTGSSGSGAGPGGVSGSGNGGGVGGVGTGSGSGGPPGPGGVGAGRSRTGTGVGEWIGAAEELVEEVGAAGPGAFGVVLGVCAVAAVVGAVWWRRGRG